MGLALLCLFERIPGVGNNFASLVSLVVEIVRFAFIWTEWADTKEAREVRKVDGIVDLVMSGGRGRCQC